MKKINLDEIIANGIKVSGFRGTTTYLSALSLSLALKSYFKTQHNIGNNIFLLNEDGSRSEESDEDYTFEYMTNCFETIVHFQHFFELVCKDILRSDHPLLSVDAFNKPQLLYKLIHNENLSSKEIEELRTIEFREALERVCAMPANAGTTTDLIVSLFKEWREPLTRLNTLRNRFWHRGTFFLKYEALDLFIGNYIFPIFMEITKQSSYKDLDILWNYKPLKCGINLINEIEKETTKGYLYDRTKVAVLKEFGRAAYKNPVVIMNDQIAEQRNNWLREKAERLLKQI